MGVVASVELGADEIAGAAIAFAGGGAAGAFTAEVLADEGAAGGLAALGATPPPRLASLESTGVMGMSSGAFLTTKRTRASGSTAR